MRLLFVTVLLATGAIQEATACSLTYSPKVAFDPNTIIFEGVVLRIETDSTVYTGDWGDGFERGREGAPGYQRGAALILEPVAVVNAPAGAERFAVYPADIGAACEYIFWTAERLAQAYTVGERVLVVATVHDGDPSGLRATAVPLVVSRYTDLLSRISPLETFGITMEPWSTTAGYDRDDSRTPERVLQAIEDGEHYFWRRPDGEGVSEQERVILAATAREALEGRRSYEYERDLALLHAAHSDEERIGLLFKARWYMYSTPRPGSHRVEDCAYADLVQRHLPSEQLRDELGARILRWNLRPLPPYSACEEVVRQEEEEDRRIRSGPSQ